MIHPRLRQAMVVVGTSGSEIYKAPEEKLRRLCGKSLSSLKAELENLKRLQKFS